MSLDVSLSSQYLSALFLLAPRLGERVDIRLSSPLASSPYAYMTSSVVSEAGYQWLEVSEGHFVYEPCPDAAHAADHSLLLAEADWSAASYAYALVALLPLGTECYLPQLVLPSLQGDSRYLPLYMERLGVYTEISEEKIRIYRGEQRGGDCFEADMSPCPDLVPALVAALVGCEVAFRLRGIGHLRVKESNRLEVLGSEFAKLGVSLGIGQDELYWEGDLREPRVPLSPPVIDPHQDHRIAMALALMTQRVGRLRIQAPEVVAKSFPSYWTQLGKLFMIKPL